MERELPILGSESTQGGLNTIRVGGLSDIVKEHQSKIGGAIIIDFDGALCLHGKNNKVIPNVLRLRNLLRIAGKADRFLFSTGRVDLSGDDFIAKHVAGMVDSISKSAGLAVSYCPFLTSKSENFLKDLIHRVNPVCSVDFDATPGKFFGCNKKTLEFGEKALTDGLDLTIIGSGTFDERVAREIIKGNPLSDRVSFFNMGLGLI